MFCFTDRTRAHLLFRPKAWSLEAGAWSRLGDTPGYEANKSPAP